MRVTFLGQITTRDGALVIVLDAANNDDHPGLPYISGMLQSYVSDCPFEKLARYELTGPVLLDGTSSASPQDISKVGGFTNLVFTLRSLFS